jgi:hypothetical protein
VVAVIGFLLPNEKHLERLRISFVTSSHDIQIVIMSSKIDMPIRVREEGDGRLPTDVKPLNYKLVLEPDFEKLTFKGLVEIE